MMKYLKTLRYRIILHGRALRQVDETQRGVYSEHFPGVGKLAYNNRFRMIEKKKRMRVNGYHEDIRRQIPLSPNEYFMRGGV